MFHSNFFHNSFFLGCPHINHTNICKGVSKWTSGGMRDFANLDEMNDAIINSVNAHVKRSDHLFLLGDILFGPKVKFNEFFDRINCENLYLIFGNHDDFIRNDIEKLSRFKICENYLEIFIDNKLLCLFHYPIHEWRDCSKGSYCICSHSHGMSEYSNYKTSKYKCLDVGWDVFQKPLDFLEIKAIMETKENKGHH